MHLAIVGNIGSGKSYWSKEIKKRLSFAKLITEPLEPLEKSGSFDAYYDNPENNAFSFQLGMITNRLNVYNNIKKGDHYIEDGHFEMDAQIFAKKHKTLNNPFYKTVYDTCKSKFKDRTVIYIYITTKPVKCMENVKNRARPAELQHLDIKYLRDIQRRLRKFIKKYKYIEFNPEKDNIDNLMNDIDSYNFK